MKGKGQGSGDEKAGKYGEKVNARAAELMGDESVADQGNTVDSLNLDYIRYCYGMNERGDAMLLATLLEGRYLYVVSSERNKGTWYFWDRHVWQEDEHSSIINMCEEVALAFERYAEDQAEHRQENIAAMIKSGKSEREARAIQGEREKKYRKRAWKLRSEAGINKAISLVTAVTVKDGDKWVAPKISTTASMLDQQVWLLPCRNGVLDLKRGILSPGRPEDLMTKRLDIDYDPEADYSFWQQVIEDIAVDPQVKGSAELPGFLQRLFGYAATGNVNEEALVIFIGPGRNGKGAILESVQKLMGPFFHKANRSLFVEQKFEPPPSATSEHIAALIGKRLVVGAETNKKQKIDLGRVKEITGGGSLNYRKNYGSEQTFEQTHTLILETNELSAGITSSFSMVQRLVLVDFTYRFVDDVAAAAKKDPALKDQFKQKDKDLKRKLKTRHQQQGILRWIVEGCLAWCDGGLQIPECVLSFRDRLGKEEDRIGSMMDEMLVYRPEREELRMLLADFYKCLDWWWRENIIDSDSGSRLPAKVTVSKYLKDRGFRVGNKGGKVWVWHFDVNDSYKLIDDFKALAREF